LVCLLDGLDICYNPSGRDRTAYKKLCYKTNSGMRWSETHPTFFFKPHVRMHIFCGHTCDTLQYLYFINYDS